MDDKSERLKTNEEIIEELTKDLESSCIKENDNYTTSRTISKNRKMVICRMIAMNV